MKQRLQKKKELSHFNPDDVASSEAGIFGLPFSDEEAAVILIPVPWEVTVSYRAGTAGGPEAIRQASLQVDLHDEDMPEIWRSGIHLLPIPDDVRKKSGFLRKKAEKISMLLSGVGTGKILKMTIR